MKKGQRVSTPAHAEWVEGVSPTHPARNSVATRFALLPHLAPDLPRRIDLVADYRIRDVEASRVAIAVFK